MFPGMNSRQAAQMMKKMGIQQQDIDATEVIIKTEDKELIIHNPQVAKVNMMGQETFQITGQIEEREISTAPEVNEDDVETVMEQTGCTKEQAREAIENNDFDLAAAIMALQEEENNS